METEIKIMLLEKARKLEKFEEELREFIFDTIQEIEKKKKTLNRVDISQVYEYIDNLNLTDSISNFIIKILGLQNVLCDTSNH